MVGFSVTVLFEEDDCLPGILFPATADLAAFKIVGLLEILSYSIFVPTPSKAPVPAFTSVLVNEFLLPEVLLTVGLVTVLGDVVLVVSVGEALVDAMLGFVEMVFAIGVVTLVEVLVVFDVRVGLVVTALCAGFSVAVGVIVLLALICR